MLFKGNSSKLELLIEKIQANKEGSSEEAGSLANEEINVGGPGSLWDVGSDGRGGSLSPASSRATPTSAGEVTDVEAQATLGVTSQTPYQCAFCERAFPRLSYLKRHEQHCCSLLDNGTHKGEPSTSSISMDNTAAFSPTFKKEYKKDFIDSNTKSKVAVVWCTKPAIMLNEKCFPKNSLAKVANTFSCISQNPENENIMVSNVPNMCPSSIITLPQPLEIKGNEKKLYCYTSAGLVSKPAVFSASLSTSSHTNHLDTKQLSKGDEKIGGSMQCIVTSMIGNKKKSEGKRKVGESDVTDAVEKVVKHKKNLIEKKSYNDNGSNRFEVCFPKKSKDKLKEKDSRLKCNITSSNLKNDNSFDNENKELQTKVPIHTIVSLNSDISKSIPVKINSCSSHENQNVKNVTINVPLETIKPKVTVSKTSISEVSIKTPMIAQKEVINNSNSESCSSDGKKSCKISPSICVVPSSYIMNNSLGKSSIRTNDLSALQSLEDNASSNPPVPNISISLVSIKPISIPVVPPIPVVSRTGIISTNIKKSQTDELSEKKSSLPKSPNKVDIPVSKEGVMVVKSSISEESVVEDDGVNGQGNVWVEEKMYSFVEEELRQLGDDPVLEDKVITSHKELEHDKEDKTFKVKSPGEKDKPKPKDVAPFTDSSGEIITEDVFSYIENELMRLDAMDDIEPLNTSSGDLSSSISMNSSINDSGFCPSGMKTPDSSHRSRKFSESSCALSVEDWGLLSSKGSTDPKNIAASSDNLLNLDADDIRPRGRRSTFSEFNRPNKPTKPRLRRFSISDSHGTLNTEESPGAESLLCLKSLDSWKMEASDPSCRKKIKINENSDLKDEDNDELCKVEEKSLVKSSTDALELTSEKCIEDTDEVKHLPNSPINNDTAIQITPENCNTNSICANSGSIKDFNIQIKKETINIFPKKRSVNQVDLKDIIEIPKKSKNLEHEKVLIETPLDRIRDNDKAKMAEKLQCEITSASPFSPEAALDQKKLLSEGEDLHSSSNTNLKSILNVQIPLTHVQLSKKHYEVLSPSSSNNDNPISNTLNLGIGASVQDQLSSPILKTIDPFHYQCTPPNGNKIKQRMSPILSPISPALPKDNTTGLGDQYPWLPIMEHKTPVSSKTAAPSNAYVFVTPPSFHSSSSSTVTMEETPSPPISVSSITSNSNQSFTYQKLQTNCQLDSNNPVNDVPTSSIKEDKLCPFDRNSLYDEYLKSNLQYLKPQSLNDKVADTSKPSFYFTDDSFIQSYLYTSKDADSCKPQKGQEMISLKIPYKDPKSNSLISKLGVFNSKNNNKENFFTSPVDFLNTIGGKTSKCVEIDEIDFPKPLKYYEDASSPGEKNESYENVKYDLNNVQNKQNNCAEIPTNDLYRIENFEENEMDAKQPSVHIQVRTGALAEQRGKSRAILSKFSHPLIQAGLQHPCKVEPKVILIRTGLSSPDSPIDEKIGNDNCFPDRILDDNYDRKFSAENLLYKSNNQANHYIENDFKDESQQNSDSVHSKCDNLDRKIQLNIPYDTNLPKKLDIENDIGIGNNNEMDNKEQANTNKTKSTNGNKNKSLETSDNAINSIENLPDVNKCLDSEKQVLTKKSSKKIISKRNRKRVFRKLVKEKELFGEKELDIKKEKTDNPENIFENTNLTIKDGSKYSNIKTKRNMNYISEGKNDFSSSSKKSENGVLVHGLHNYNAESKDETCSYRNFTSIAEDKHNKKIKLPADMQSCSKASEYMNLQKGKLTSEEQSKCFVDSLHGTLNKPGPPISSNLNNINIKSEPFDETQSMPAFDICGLKGVKIKSEPLDEPQNTSGSFIWSNFDTSNIKPEPFLESQSTPDAFKSNNLNGIRIKSEPLKYESEIFHDMWEHNAGNFKCVTKVVEGTAMLRAAIRKKKYNAARVKRNMAKRRRKKAEKKKNTNLSKRSKYKSSLKENSKNKLFSYSRAGEIFDPNNLSTASSDALMAGITVHCTPEGVTLRLNCVENMDNETLKLESSVLNGNKSNQAQGIFTKSKEKFLMSPSKKNPKCEDNYSKITVASNKDSLECVKNMKDEYLKSQNVALKVNKCNQTKDVTIAKQNFVGKSPSKFKPKCNNPENSVASNNNLTEDNEKTLNKSLKLESSCMKVDKSNDQIVEPKNYPVTAIVSCNDLSDSIEDMNSESLKLESSCLNVSKSKEEQNGKSEANIEFTLTNNKTKSKIDLERKVASDNVFDCMKNIAPKSLKFENTSLNLNKCSLAQSMAKVKENFVVTTHIKKKPVCNDYPDNAFEIKKVSHGIENTNSESLEFESLGLKVSKCNPVQNLDKTKDKIIDMAASKKPKFKQDYQEFALASKNNTSECITNRKNDCLKSEKSCLKENKSNKAQITDKCKDNLVVLNPNKKNPDCKDHFSDGTAIANNELIDGKVISEKSRQILVSHNKATKSRQKTSNENVQSKELCEETINAITEPFNPPKSVLDFFEDFESLDSYEETGKAITESINPSKSVSELFDDFESLLGTMEDGDQETNLIDQCKFDNLLAHSKEHGADTITLNGSSSSSTFTNCRKSNDIKDLPSTSITNKSTNMEVNLPVVKMSLDISNHSVLSTESLPSNVTKNDMNASLPSNITKNVSESKNQNKLDMKTNPNQIGSTESLKKRVSHSQNVPSNEKNLHVENIGMRNKIALEGNCPANKSSLLLTSKYRNQNSINSASNEVQINYKMPNTNKSKIPLNNRNYDSTSCELTGKKVRRKSLFENKACQSYINTNYVYSRNLISKRGSNGNLKDGKDKQKFTNKIDFDMKNDLSKTYECRKDKNNNEFEHDHNYNSKRFRRKRKYKDLKVDYSTKKDTSLRNPNINCTKEIINHNQNTDQRSKLKNTFRDKFISSPLIKNVNISNKNVNEEFHKGESVTTTKEIPPREITTEKELHNRESIYTIYQEKNVIAVSKTSILLNKNTKGKSNVPFDPETESVKIETSMDDISTSLETINTKKFKANKQNKIALDNKVYSATFLENLGSKNSENESPSLPEKKVPLTEIKNCVKSSVTTSKASHLENDEKFETDINSFETAEKTEKSIAYGKEVNYLSSPKHISLVNNMNDNPQSSPDSPHFGLIHKLAQTTSNSGYTKIVVKKVRSSSIDRKKSQGLLSTTLKKNIVTQRDELFGNQLQVKGNNSLSKDSSNADKDESISTKTPKIENNRDLDNPKKDGRKSSISKVDSITDCGEAPIINSSLQQSNVALNKLNENYKDNINNGDNEMSPLENLEAMVDTHLPSVTSRYSKFETNKVNLQNSGSVNEFISPECSLGISVDLISKDNNFCSDVNENISFVNSFLSTPEEKNETRKLDNFHSSSSHVEHRNEGVFNQPKCNESLSSNLQPLDLRLERSEVPCGPDGASIKGFSYSIDLNSGLVNVISTEQPEYTSNITSEVLVEKEIKSINELAISTSASPVYAVQTLNCSASAVSEGPLIMPIYSLCESKAQTNSSQVMQIYSYNADDFTIGDYNSKPIYSNPSSISSVITPNISMTNTGLNNDGSLVVPVYSISSSNNINICSSQGLSENATILETSQTFPVYLLNPFDSSNSLPCAQISTIYTGNILDESINTFPSEQVFGPQIMPIYSVETESHMNSTTFGITPLSSTSENENNVNLHNLEVPDLSSQTSSGGDIVVNVEYIENVTKSLDQERLKENSEVSVKDNSDQIEYYNQKGSTSFPNSIITEEEYQNVESIRESVNYNYARSVPEIGNLDTEISNLEYSENLVDLGNLEYGDNIKSETEDDESSNTDIGSNHGGSEGGGSMDFMLLDSMTHADQLPFRCEFCGRLFKHKRSRDRHVKLHTGDKKYKCCHCEAAFSRSDHLKIHMKTHDTQKPYQCSVCNRGYNTAAALTAHMQNHKAKLTAHALNQLLKDHAQESPDASNLNSLLKESSPNPADTAAFSQLLKEASSVPSPEGSSHPLGHLLLRESPTDHHTLNHFLGDPPKEQLDSPRGLERGVVASPVIASPSPGRENCSPASSPVSSISCPICHVTCRNHTHLQRHMSRHHSEETGDRPASRGGSAISSTGGGVSSGVSSTPSTPSPRPPSSISSPRLPIPNPFMFLVGGKLSCIYCSRDGFLSLEALQMHIQSQHSSLLNGDNREMASTLNLPSPLGSSLGAGGLNLNNLSPLAPSSSRGVTCELCGARVSGVPALQRHVVTAHTFTDLLARAAEGVFCAQCLLPFSNPGALAEHIKLVHASPVLSAVLNKRPPSPPNEGPTDLSKKTRRCDNLSDLPANTLLCSQCNAPFTNFEAFRRHLKTHLESNDHVGSSMSGSQQLICPECRLPLTSENALEVHMATHLGATCTEYGCQACLKLFQKPDELQKHLMDIHAHHLYRCALCKEMFDSKVSIQVHFAVKHSNECKVHKCTRCSLIFRTQSEFEAHVRSSHLRLPNGDGNGSNALGNGNSSNGMYRCLLCTLSLSSEAELAAHVSTHQRQFQCSLCDDAFHVEFLLDKHMQSAHNSELNGNIPQPENLAKSRRSPLKKELKCDICDSDFTSEIALLGHRKQAHNIKNNSINNNNTKTAASALSLFCAYCSEACKSRADLEIHMKSHQSSGGRHKCNICDELCPSAGLLAQHKLSHIKVLSGNTCAVCREPLTSEHQFTSHQNEHHPAPLPQPCVVCRQTLVTDIEVSVHARFHSAKAAVQETAVTSAILNNTLQPTVFTTATTVSHTNSESNSRNSSSPQMSPRLRCPECNIKLETSDEAEAHAQIHQNQQKQSSSARTYQCIKCQESFASESEIEAHVASHLLHEGSTHECHLCRSTFDTPLRLQCHLIEHTFEGCGSFTCYMCSSVFTTASRLQQHMVEHGLAARPYDCHHCHQKFFFRAELENHALSHPEATDGSCRECLSNYPDLPRFHNRCSWPSVLATAEGTTASTQISPARPTQNGSPHQIHKEEIEPSTNGHSIPEADPSQEDLQP